MTQKLNTKSRGRPRAFSEEQALDAAMRVFASKGYDAASLADLTDAMRINRVSMYAAFGNKEALFVKAMTRYTEVGTARFAQSLMEGSARQALERLLNESVKMFCDTEEHGVCFVTQGPLTSKEVSEATRQFIAEKRTHIELLLAFRFDRAVSEGEMPRDFQVSDWARFYAVLIQGLALQAQHGGTRDELLRVVDLTMKQWPACKS